MNKFWLLALLALLIVPSAFAIADKGFQISNEFSPALIVDAPKLEYYKLDQNITFNVHVFNAITGIPLSDYLNATYNLSCVAHFYNSTGDKIAEDILIYDGDYDFYDTIINPLIINVSGRHNYRVWCGIFDPNAQPADLIIGGWVSSYFDITVTGKAPPGDNMIIFIFIIFIAILGSLIYLIFDIFAKLITFDIEIKDVIFNLVAYLALITFNFFNISYIGNTLIDSTTNLFIQIGAFTNILIPIVAFIITYFHDKTQWRQDEEI